MMPAAKMQTGQLIPVWYNALVRACRLDRQTFQLAQGAIPLPNQSANVWSVFDFIPPYSIDHWWDPAQLNSFASNYGAVINNLLPTSADPDPVAEAVSEWNNASDYPYAVTADRLKAELASKPGVSFMFVPGMEAVKVSDTWAGGRLFPISASVSKKRSAVLSLLNDFPDSVVKIEYQHIGTFVGPPLSKEYASSELSPWYVPSALRLGLDHKGGDVWKEVPPTWEQTFGSSGSMQRATISIVVVDGSTTTTDSVADTMWDRLAEEWDVVPFLPPRAVASIPAKKVVSASESMLDLKGAESVHRTEVTTPLGSPFILGVNVVPIRKFLI